MTGESAWLTERFEEHRPRLRAVAHRMLGSVGESDDALREARLRLGRAGPGGVEDLPAWLTTVVARVCLSMLRARRAHPTEGVDGGTTRSAADSADDDAGQETLMADSVGLALLVVLDTLTPAERLAYVLHDMFAVPFDEIGRMLDGDAEAARRLASRARRRVRGGAPAPDPDLLGQRRVVDAFLAASRDGDLEALVAVLDHDVVLRADAGANPMGKPVVLRGRHEVAEGANAAAGRARFSQPALVNGGVGLVMAPQGRIFVVLGFAIADERITGIDVIADPGRLRELDLAVLDM
ncbi:sigma factor [Phytomonospora sp. NPDC050363]|uniref:sigma factor n=1 Tax=Phytomonospora sp. NPDC050363 TaxID=3155642 RepID=UPI00340532FE